MHPALWMARAEARRLHVDLFERDMVVTSGLRKRTPGGSSLHQSGRAMDIRSRNMTRENQLRFSTLLQEILGEDFDVIVEGPHAPDPRYRNRVAHIHVEYDPKGRHAQRMKELT